VDACEGGVSTPCEPAGKFQAGGDPRAPERPGNKESRWQNLGQSDCNHVGGTYATIFLGLAEEKRLRAESSTDPFSLL